MANTRPLILVCNDDGIDAPGIQALMEVAKEHGDIIVVAPDGPQSGMGHAISIGKPLRLHQRHLSSKETHRYACTGTPVDCIKLARGSKLAVNPDLVVSGINHGSNASISVLYSGTMSAAVEGAIEGVPSIGFSLTDFAHDADFTGAQWVAHQVIEKALKNPFPKNVALNVNIPDLPKDEIKGIRITRQAKGRWVEQFDHRVDPYGRDYYWLTGNFALDDEAEDTDIWALENGYASVCPVQIDMTAHDALKGLSDWGL